MYDCDCEDCKTERLTLANKNDETQFKQVLTAVENAFKHLHKTGNYDYTQLTASKEYKTLVTETNNVLQSGIVDNDIPPEMLNSLQNDVFVFSGLKTHAQLLEASRQLLTNDGKVKSFSQFSQDVATIKSNYNQNYLEAEYQFAVTSSQMAGKWAQADNDRYNLQYRTANDDKVRASHAALDKITLPPTDAFWLSYYPPNGWRCRCNAVQVRKTKYEVSDSKAAIAAGEKATTQLDKNNKNKLEIFRFNPGKQKVIFPPKHPYYKVKDATKAKQAIKQIAHIPDGINTYENKLGITVKTEMFEHLSRPTKFYNQIKGAKGAFYHPTANYVHIPFDNRRKRSKWKAESVVYHEFGHAADWHNNYRTSKVVKSVMSKYRKQLSANENNGYKEADKQAQIQLYDAITKKDFNKMEQIGAILDTIMSLNPNYGSGHTKQYFKSAGKKEAEFIAHAFENRYAENPIFKKLLPDMYNDMIQMIDDLKPKQE